MSIKIALADDHQLVRKGIKLLLENIKGFAVICEAENGRDLINQIGLQQNIPDIVLVDLNMPVLNGHDTTVELKSLYPEVKIIALSVDNELHVIRDLIRSGANAYLFKDSSPEVFKKVLLEVHEKGYYYSQDVIESLVNPDVRRPASEISRENQKLIASLTNRELEFVINCCSELTYKEIADKMNVSARTVDGYREVTFDKLNVKSRTGIVLFAFQSGLLKDYDKK